MPLDRWCRKDHVRKMTGQGTKRDGFVKIRHFGLMAAAHAPTRLARA
jgi:hypothetical protein